MNLDFRCGQLEGFALAIELVFVPTVAERLVCRQSTAAKRYAVTSLQVVGVASGIHDNKVAFNFQRAVVIYGDFNGFHGFGYSI